MIRKVLLDIDGCMNHFIIEAMEKFGYPVNYDEYEPACGWDMLKCMQKKYGVKVTPAEFWGSVKREWWSESKTSDECFDIIARAEQLVGRENVCLLTAPTLDPECVAGKIEWIQSRMPKWLQRQFLIGPRKHFCAREDHLLVDDADHNCIEFRQHGGQTILVPRPWNTNHDLKHETRLYINARFDQLEQRQTISYTGVDHRLCEASKAAHNG